MAAMARAPGSADSRGGGGPELLAAAAEEVCAGSRGGMGTIIFSSFFLDERSYRLAGRRHSYIPDQGLTRRRRIQSTQTRISFSDGGSPEPHSPERVGGGA
jgi:hypothetical protein